MSDPIPYFVGVYGFLQISMQDVDLLDDKGRPIKKKYTMGEQDAIAIYKWLSDKLIGVNSQTLRSMARETDKKVSKLLNDHSVVNNFLLSIMLLREYVDNEGLQYEKILLTPKINRLVDVVDEAVSDEEFSIDIKRTTFRTADNIYRQFAGKCQLSDEVREAKFKRMLHGNKAKIQSRT